MFTIVTHITQNLWTYHMKMEMSPFLVLELILTRNNLCLPLRTSSCHLISHHRHPQNSLANKPSNTHITQYLWTNTRKKEKKSSFPISGLVSTQRNTCLAILINSHHLIGWHGHPKIFQPTIVRCTYPTKSVN